MRWLRTNLTKKQFIKLFAALVSFIKNILRLVREGICWLQGNLTNKQFIFLSAVLVGISSGLAAITLKSFAHLILVATSVEYSGVFHYVFLALPLTGILLTVLVTDKVFKGKFEKGTSHILDSISRKSGIVPEEQMYAQIATSSLTVGFGGSAGLESPIVITGAAFGSNYAITYKLNYKERTLLLACGVAAGIAAAFNAPIAGVLFALEVLLADISISAFIPIIISAASGAIISKIFLQDDILLSFHLQQPFNYYYVPFYILLGVIAGFVSVYHSRLFIRVEKWISKNKKRKYRNALVGGVLLAGLIFLFPGLFGEGYQSIKALSTSNPQSILNDSPLLSGMNQNEWIVMLFTGVVVLIKAIATGITIGSGGNGGNFAPSLFVGANLGFFFSSLINLLHIANIPVSNFTIVGMAGILSGIFHAPLTAIFLIAEITGGYMLMIPLMIVSSISYAISRYLEPLSMDARKLASDGKWSAFSKDRNILANIRTAGLIETDFPKISPESKLGDLVMLIPKSKRAVFAVVSADSVLVGIVTFDSVKELMFQRQLYESVSVRELMVPPAQTIHPNEPMDEVMKKFDETGLASLPVTEEGKFKGFITKVEIFSVYRNMLGTATIE